MSPITSSLGLGALTSWLSGSDKTETNAAGNSSGQEPITTLTDSAQSKTIEKPTATTPPQSPTLKTVDGIADQLTFTTLSSNPSSDHDAESYLHVEPAREVAGSSDLESAGPKSRKGAFQAEDEFTETMTAACSVGPGSAEFFDAISHVYHSSPSQVARGDFLKGLINSCVKEKRITFDAGLKVLDYGAGTGSLSHALAPHVSEILAIDKSPKMVEQYNVIAARENKTECRMKAVQGDLTTHFLTGRETDLEHPDGISADFDVVALCLAVDFFTHEDIDDDGKHAELVRSLSTMTDLLKKRGTLLIIDVEKRDDEDADAHEGFKSTGHGSKDIVHALEELGMEDARVVGSGEFSFQVEDGGSGRVLGRKETYFMLMARRGTGVGKRSGERA